MATTRYFRGVYPRQKLFLSNGSYIQLSDIGDEAGIYKTEDPFIHSEIDSMLRERRGGLQEIDQSTYEDLKKNAKPSPAPFREELRFGVGLTRNNLPVVDPPQFPPQPTDMFGQVDLAAAAESNAPRPGVVNLDRPTATRPQ